ncbi:hypothetical protein XPA_010229 [Xanthoria parietina]
MDSSNMAKNRRLPRHWFRGCPSAFVDITIAEDAQLNCSKEIIDQEVSVQLARKPETAAQTRRRSHRERDKQQDQNHASTTS